MKCITSAIHPLFPSCFTSQVLNGHQRNDTRIEDFCDAQIFKTHPLFSKDPTALQIMLYYDEVEVANPLGSKCGKHKLGTVILNRVSVWRENSSPSPLGFPTSNMATKRYTIDVCKQNVKNSEDMTTLQTLIESPVYLYCPYWFNALHS